MYKVDATGMQLLLGYSDVFEVPFSNLTDAIGKLNMHKTLSIISELISVRNAKLNPVRVFNYEISVPFETAVKKEILGIEEKLVNGIPSNSFSSVSLVNFTDLFVISYSLVTEPV